MTSAKSRAQIGKATTFVPLTISGIYAEYLFASFDLSCIAEPTKGTTIEWRWNGSSIFHLKHFTTCAHFLPCCRFKGSFSEVKAFFGCYYCRCCCRCQPFSNEIRVSNLIPKHQLQFQFRFQWDVMKKNYVNRNIEENHVCGNVETPIDYRIVSKRGESHSASCHFYIWWKTRQENKNEERRLQTEMLNWWADEMERVKPNKKENNNNNNSHNNHNSNNKRK